MWDSRRRRRRRKWVATSSTLERIRTSLDYVDQPKNRTITPGRTQKSKTNVGEVVEGVGNAPFFRAIGPKLVGRPNVH